MQPKLLSTFACISVIMLSTFMLPACSDDSPTVVPPVEDEEFSMEFKVVDTQGDPVEGIQLALFNDHDYFQGKNDEKAAMVVRFAMTTETRAVLYVNDVAGDTVQTLIDSQQLIGLHEVMWRGQDDFGTPQNSGRYQIHLRIYSHEETLVYADSLGVLLSQPDADMHIATSDNNGIILLEDKRLFPQLYSLPAMMATDENADFLGTFNVTRTMRAFFRDPNSMTTISAEFDIGPDTKHLTQVWGPSKATVGQKRQRAEKTDHIRPEAVDVIPLDFEQGLIVAYPNPFN